MSRKPIMLELIPAGEPNRRYRTSGGRVYVTDTGGSLHRVLWHTLDDPVVTDGKLGKRVVWFVKDALHDGLEFVAVKQEHADEIRRCINGSWTAIIAYVRGNYRRWIQEVQVK